MTVTTSYAVSSTIFVEDKHLPGAKPTLQLKNEKRSDKIHQETQLYTDRKFLPGSNMDRSVCSRGLMSAKF